MIRLLLHQKRIHEDGAIEERIVWTVPKSSKSPEGVRYRLAFILKGAKMPSVLYDNHHPKGHHKHIDGNEMSYDFLSIERLLVDFDSDVQEVKNSEVF